MWSPNIYHVPKVESPELGIKWMVWTVTLLGSCPFTKRSGWTGRLDLRVIVFSGLKRQAISVAT